MLRSWNLRGRSPMPGRPRSRAFHQARDAGDAGRMAEAALGLPSGQQFGEHPGQIPALIHEAYAAAADPRSGPAWPPRSRGRGPTAATRR